MKCRVCGGNMKIEDAYCPFCGMPNPDAVKHREDMKKYEKRFSKTEKEVISTARSYSVKSIKTVVILVLVIVVLIMFVLNVFHYDLAYAINENSIRKNADVYIEQLDEYEETEQYMAMAAYYDANNLYRVDVFDEYKAVVNVAARYGYVMEELSSLLCREIIVYGDAETALEGLCEYVQWLYDECERKEYADPDQWTERHTESIENMKAEINLLIQTYCGFSDEEMVRFETASEARKQIMIEEAMGLYDTDTES